MSTAPKIRRRTSRPYALSYFVARIALRTALASLSLLVAPQLRAQSEDSQQSSPDVAEAARQARARKQQAAERHIYTNEDLRRGKILTPEDQDRAAAANQKNSTAPATPDAKPLDANSATPQEPLGDVARRYRHAKKSSPFHLPSTQGELATPEFVAPIAEPSSNHQPPSRSRSFVAPKPAAPLSRAIAPRAPSLPSPRMNRVNPFVGRRTQPSPPEVMMDRPVEPSHTLQPKSFSAPLSRAASPAANVAVVRPGDTLWNLSRRHLGRGTRWLELLAANPELNDPTRLAPGTQLILPARTVAHRHLVQTVTIQSGDSLSKLALATYGHASYWPCLASANPTVANAHQLHIGQSITLPASCTP